MTETNKIDGQRKTDAKTYTMLKQPPTANQIIILNSLGVKPLPTKGDCAVLIHYFNNAKDGTIDNTYYNDRIQTFIKNQHRFIGKKVKFKIQDSILGIVEYIFFPSFSMSTLFAYITKINGAKQRYKTQNLIVVE